MPALERLRPLLYPLLLAGPVGLGLLRWRAALPVGSALTLALLVLLGACCERLRTTCFTARLRAVFQ